MARHRGLKIGFSVIVLFILGIAIYSGSYYWSDTNEIEPGDLKITKVIVQKAKSESPLGEKSDWLEIQNTTDRELHLEKGEWYITDKAEKRPFRFPLPELFIMPGEKVRIWCDGQDMHGNEIHTNFKLDDDGEQVAIFVVKNDEEIITIDQFFYSKAKGTRGFERKNNGTSPID